MAGAKMMKLFKDDNNQVFAYEEDGSQDHLIQGKTSITQAEADALIAANDQQSFNALTYAQKRASAYPPITDYLDGIVKGDQEQVAAYVAACLAVKATYPKPALEVTP
jgi:hypothetical protein